MNPSVQNRIVQIELPLNDGGYSYFSGYIFSDGLVLTCSHGFSDHENYHPTKNISIRSYNFSAEIEFTASNFAGLSDVDEMFEFVSESFDIVLLKCEEAKGDYQETQGASLYKSGNWEAGGYPFFSRESKDTKGYKSFDGEFTAIEQGAKSIKLSVSKPKLEAMSDWKSVSGSPVFIHGKLVGVLRCYSTYNDDSNNKVTIKDQLEASYLKELLLDENSGFKEKLLTISSKSRNYHEQQFSKVLDVDLKNFLTNRLAVDESSILTALLESERLECLEFFVEAKHKYPDSSVVDNAFLYLLSLGYEREGGFEALEANNEPYNDVPVVREEGCEFFMAAHDQRTPQFRKINNELTPSKYCMSASPENGIQDDPTNDIAEGFLSEKADENAVVARIFGDFKPSTTRVYDSNRKRKIVQIMLQNEKNHYYWPLEVTENCKARLQKIHEAFPSIKILNISDDDELDFEEEGLFSGLATFIKD